MGELVFLDVHLGNRYVDQLPYLKPEALHGCMKACFLCTLAQMKYFRGRVLKFEISSDSGKKS